MKKNKSTATNNGPIFAVGDDNVIIAVDSLTDKQPDQVTFTSASQLEKLASSWPTSRLVAIWNEMAGAVPFDDLKPVKKFSNRKTGATRIWKAIQRLEAETAPQAATVAPEAADSTKEAKAKKKTAKAPQSADAKPAREGSKKAKVIALLEQPEGASIKEIQAATNWRPHSVRGFISGNLVKKMGLNVESFKRESGERCYKIAG